MIAKSEREQIIALINREVVPAIGCTEPIAVALCVAKATETLGKRPEKIKALLSANILKNAMGVGIPGTGMIGLPIAIALGALIGKSEYQLEVLKDSTPEAVEEGKKLIDSQAICIGLKKDIDEKLYIEIICEADNDKATAIISGGHTNFIYVSHNNDVILNKQATSSSEEELIRALVLSHLTVIYIKQSLGRLSALCGCVVAATGSSCGITYLMGGNYEQITFAVQNMIANITGMICDGAKPSCALKLTSGVSTAVFSAILAMEHKCVSSVEGIIDDNVDRSIRNLTKIGSQGMNETDKLVLEIMTHKQCD